MDAPLKVQGLAIEMGAVPVQQLAKQMMQELSKTMVNDRECQAIVYRLLENYFQIKSVDYILNPILTVTSDILDQLIQVFIRLKAHEPIQYVLGKTTFLGLDFKVTPDVLIPRSETEEWMYSLIQNLSMPKTILDIGTGSGCIAITLKKHFPLASVQGIDISGLALAIAQQNGQELNTPIQWVQKDILTQSLGQKTWELIVSNPPYIPIGEKHSLSPQVAVYEPALSLFTEKPYQFYERIIALSAHHLTSNGILCVEIHEQFGQEIMRLFHHAHFKQVQLCHDLSAKPRWIIAQAPSMQ